jgi:putrescine transport system substrate-binding protein
MPYLGIDPDTTDVADYQKVVEAFRPIRPYIATFDNTNYLNAIPNGELCVINNWSGDYAVAKARAEEAGLTLNLAYFVPKTGAPAWFDVFSIPSDAPNKDNAYTFLNFMLKPEVIAGCTNYTAYANANLASKPFVDPAILADPAVYPDEETIKRLWTPKPLNEEQDRAITRAWTEIKTG